MTILEAVKTRHVVRNYIDKPISIEIIGLLNARISENNKNYDLAIQLVVNDESAFTTVTKLIRAKGIKNYLILAGNDTPDLDEKLGYSGADLMLYAQTLGLNTWWVGDTFNRKTINKVAKGEKVIGIIAVGYGVSQGVPHKTKNPNEVSLYINKAPEWFKNGVSAALFSPTAYNKQKFMIKGSEYKVSLICTNGVFSGVELGLLKYHFEVGAGKKNFEWV